ncbi:MAG: hypothetical protein ACTSU5_03480 [Promethearchaeota archaeon]
MGKIVIFASLVASVFAVLAVPGSRNGGGEPVWTPLVRAQDNGEYEIKEGDLWQNASWIERGVTSVNITVNATRLELLTGQDAAFVNLSLSYPNGTVVNFTMNPTFSGSNEFSLLYGPNATDPRGQYSFVINIHNSTYALIHNLTSRDGSFTVGNLDPTLVAEFTSTSIRITENLNVTFHASDPDNNLTDLSIDAKVYNPSWAEVNALSVSVPASGSYEWSNLLTSGYSTVGAHVVSVNVTDGTNTVSQNYTFSVDDPGLQIVSFEFDPESKELYRGPDESVSVSVNLTTELEVGVIAAYNPTVRLKAIHGGVTKSFTLVYDVGDGQYEKDISFELTDAAGDWACWVEVEDKYGNKIDSQFTDLKVKNNPPKLSYITFNDQNVTNQFKINQGAKLNCTVGATDEENQLAKLGLNLVGPNGQFFNFTQSWSLGESILIDTTKYSAGLWSFQFYVIDSDGSTGYYDSVILVDLRVNQFERAVPYIAFGIGIVMGVGIGVALMWRKYNSALAESGRIPDEGGSQLLPKKRPPGKQGGRGGKGKTPAGKSTPTGKPSGKAGSKGPRETPTRQKGTGTGKGDQGKRPKVPETRKKPRQIRRKIS